MHQRCGRRDVIVEVDRLPIHTAAEFVERLRQRTASPSRPLLLRLRRGESALFVALDSGA